jgi:hypothetical protein
MASGCAAAPLSVGFGVGFRFLGLGKPVLFAFRFFGFFFSTTATLLAAAGAWEMVSIREKIRCLLAGAALPKMQSSSAAARRCKKHVAHMS